MAGPALRTAPQPVRPTWDDVVEGQRTDATTEEAIWAENVIANRLSQHIPEPRETNDAETLFGQLEAAAPDDDELRQALQLQRQFLGLRGVPHLSAPDMTFVPEREYQRWRDKSEDRALTDQAEQAMPRHLRRIRPQDIQFQTPSQTQMNPLLPGLPEPAPAEGRYPLTFDKAPVFAPTAASPVAPAAARSGAKLPGRMAPSRMRYRPTGGE